jgi:hypothetical protein
MSPLVKKLRGKINTYMKYGSISSILEYMYSNADILSSMHAKVVECALTSTCASPLENVEITNRRFLIDIISHGSSIDIMFLCEIHTHEV